MSFTSCQWIKTYLKPTGPAVGMFQNQNFTIKEYQLCPQDTLFAYTDGVTDIQSPEGVRFNKDRLLNHLSRRNHSAKIMVDCLKEEIECHMSDTDQHDDVTMIAIRRL